VFARLRSRIMSSTTDTTGAFRSPEFSAAGAIKPPPSLNDHESWMQLQPKGSMKADSAACRRTGGAKKEPSAARVPILEDTRRTRACSTGNLHRSSPCVHHKSGSARWFTPLVCRRKSCDGGHGHRNGQEQTMLLALVQVFPRAGAIAITASASRSSSAPASTLPDAPRPRF
jgi:hypothetical protein